MKEKITKGLSKRILSFVLMLAMVLTMMPSMKTEAMIGFEEPVLSITLYPSGCLKSMDIKLKLTANYGQAYGRVAVHNKNVLNNYNWGHFYKTGQEDWSNFDEEELKRDAGLVAIQTANEAFDFTVPESHNTVEFEDGVVDLKTNQTYYVYLWSRQVGSGYIYIHDLIKELKTENGQLKTSSGEVINADDLVTTKDDFLYRMNNAHDGEIITLGADISLKAGSAGNGDCYVIPQNCLVTLDLNGHTVDIGLGGQNADNVGVGHNSALMIKNGTYKTFDTRAGDDGILILNNVNVTDYVFLGETQAWIVNGSKIARLNVEDGMVNPGSTLNPLESGSQAWPYECSNPAPAMVGSGVTWKCLETLSEDFAQAQTGGTTYSQIIMLKDYTLDSNTDLSASGKTFDLSGYTLTTGDKVLSLSHVTGENIIRNGSINGNISMATGAGSVKLSNLDITDSISNVNHPTTIDSGHYANINGGEGKVTINGGYYSGTLTGSNYEISGGYFVNKPDQSYLKLGKCFVPTNVTENGITYKYTVAHEHSFTYSVLDDAKNTIVATCSADGCDLTDKKVTLTLTATSQNYSGSAVEATMDKSAWEAAGLTAPSIEYAAKTGSALTDGKAVNVGSYTAKITVDGNTATKDFEITKATPDGHTVVKQNGQAATCTADGYKDYYKCSDTTCNKLFTDDICTTEITDLATWKAGAGKIAALGHDWKYSAEENKIETYCAHADCPSGTDVSHKVSLTLKADNATYSETATYAASFEDTTAWTTAGLTATDVSSIKYYKATEEGGTEGTETVETLTGLAEGNYYAAITVGEVTAKKAFKIVNEEAIFAAYKVDKKTEAEGIKLEKDLEAIKMLIDEAIAAIDAKTYDSTKTLDENKAAIDAIITKLKSDIKTEWTKELTGIEKVDPTGESSADGKITGLDSTMEYSVDGGNTWIPVADGKTEITDLKAGDVQVRRKALSEDRPAGVIKTITLEYVDSDPTVSYTVEFISKGDVVKAYKNVKSGSLITKPANPDVAGFAGWYKDENCTTPWDFDVDTVKADTKIYAKYVLTVTVTLDVNGGTFADGTETKLEVNINEKLDEKTLEEIADKATNGAMLFSGWFKDEYSAEAWDFNEDIVTKDITLYIGWGYPAGHEEVAELSVTKVKDYIYTGKKITPAVSVSFGGKVLVPGTDYTVSYKNNVKAYNTVLGNNLVINEDGSIDYSNVDTAKAPTIIIKGKKNYSKKTIALNFNIQPVSLGNNADTLGDNISADICDNYATNNKRVIKVKGTVSYKGKKLNARDYTLTLVPENAKDASGNPLPKTELVGQKIPKGANGTFKLTAVGNGNYDGGFVKIITVADGTKTLKKAKITLKKIEYSGHDLTVDEIVDAAKGKLTVKIAGKPLTYGKDYTVEFPGLDKAGSRTNGGIYPIVIKGMGEYVGSRMVNVTVNGISIKKAVVTLDVVDPVYSGHHIGTNIKSVSLQGVGLTAGIDYDAVVKNDVKAGKASVTITGKGIYSGTKKVSYKIQKVKLTNEMFENVTISDNAIYLGKYDYRGGVAITPNVSIIYNGVKLINPADYSISLKNNKKAAGTAKATIRGKGNYTGSVNAIFSIGEDKIDNSKVNIKKAKISVANKIYTGREITICDNDITKAKITVKEGKKNVSKNLILGTDFEIVSYVKNVNVGKAQFIIRGIGNYDGYKLVTFKITKKDLKWWQKKLQ